VYRGANGHPVAVNKHKGENTKSAAQPPASVTFPPEPHRNLDDLAKKKKVSIAWIVREAADKYLADQGPLFGAKCQEAHRPRGRGTKGRGTRPPRRAGASPLCASCSEEKR